MSLLTSLKGLFSGAPAEWGETPAPPETALSAVCPLPAVSPFEDGPEAPFNCLVPVAESAVIAHVSTQHHCAFSQVNVSLYLLRGKLGRSLRSRRKCSFIFQQDCFPYGLI